MAPFNFADALAWHSGSAASQEALQLQEAHIPDAQEIKAFVREYAEELRHTDAWKADPGGEAQRLLGDWRRQFGQQGQFTLYRAVGCDKCGQSGYKGQIGLHALMVADDELKKLIQQRARLAELFSSALNSGMRMLKMDGREKVLMGLTDLKMVRSVCIK